MAGARRILAPVWLAAVCSLSAHEPGQWRAKVDPWILEQTSAGAETELLVFLDEQAELGAVDRLPTKEARGRYVFEQLRLVAELSQGPLLERLERSGVEYRSFWVANMVWVRGGGGLVEELALRSDVAHLYANPRVELDRPERDLLARTGTDQAVEPSLRHTLAPRVFWSKGFTGQGVVIGGQDTGYDWEHPALRSKYRGVAGGTVDHNYNWHDSIHSGGGSCGSDSPEPCDDNDHGTHTMGTMLGDDGSQNRIGMAPGATWIGCRNMDGGVGTPASYSECFEWFIAPTDLDGDNPNPDKAPDIINNSWVCPPSEGCTDPNALRRVVENTRKAGILVVVSAGNGGPDCGTITSPPGIYDASLTVGATDLHDAIAGFSSRGPVTVDGSGRIKPDVVAPGTGIRSSVRGDGYERFIGTSMSAPHVSGLAALLISSGSCLRGNVDALEKHIIGTALPLTAEQSCGVSGSEIPNGVSGFGAIRSVLPICGDGISGDTTGMAIKRLTCRNRSSRPKQKVAARLSGAGSWSCTAAGLNAAVGDRLKIRLTAEAGDGGEAGGTIDGVVDAKVVCRNQATGGEATIRPGDGEAWDCRGAGLETSDGDTLKLTISGWADP